MTPLRQCMLDDMQLRNFRPETQRNYIHHVAGFARYFNQSPEFLNIEAVRQYQLYLLNERKLSPETINQYVSSVKFLYLTTLEMPWTAEYFPQVRRPHKLPVVLSQEEILTFFDYVPSVLASGRPRSQVSIVSAIKYRQPLSVLYRTSSRHGQEGERIVMTSSAEKRL